MKFQAFHVNPGEKMKKKDVNNDLSNFMSVFPSMYEISSQVGGRQKCVKMVFFVMLLFVFFAIWKTAKNHSMHRCTILLNYD